MRVGVVLVSLSLLTLAAACGSAAGGDDDESNPAGAGGSGAGGSIGNGTCNVCLNGAFIACDADGAPTEPEVCEFGCVDGKGCAPCTPGKPVCDGKVIHECNPDGTIGAAKTNCGDFAGQVCWGGECRAACQVADDQASNLGCEFWAVDLDQQDGLNDPASAPWGVVLANAGQEVSDVFVELNEAPVGQPLALKKIKQATINPGNLVQFVLPTRELDCGAKPNDYKAPGTCLSSRAFRITASTPIVVYQFNAFTNSFSNDASLLLPTNALGQVYRVIGWGAGHPVPTNFPGIGTIIDRSYVTVVGTQPNTKVKVSPTYKIRGNPPIAETQAGGVVEATIGPFDVLNLETADSTFKEVMMKPYVADLTGSLVTASAPVAVFSGTETTAAPAHVKIPTYPGWDVGDNAMDSCCLDHLEDQLFPMEAIGTKYVITRSPIRSTGSYVEPDVLRFVGAAEVAQVTTNLPAPFDKFTLNPGEVKDTWTQTDIVVNASAPVMIGQILVSQGYVQGALTGDPSLTVFPPVDQYRTEYVFLTPPSWTTNHVVISAEPTTKVTIDGAPAAGCVVSSAGMLDGKMYESRRCPIGEGVHRLSGDAPFGIIAYGYGSAGSYAFAGGADVKKIYNPPIPK